MSDTEEFNLVSNMEQPTNEFKIVHFYNKSETYHLTRQVLLDATLSQAEYCFFYHILTKDVDSFNKTYNSFACLIPRNEFEADLYMNVHSEALSHIIQFIQTGKINDKEIYAESWKTIDEIIDLSIIFGMSHLVSRLRGLHPNETHIDEHFGFFRILVMMYANLCNDYLKGDTKYVEQFMERYDEFVGKNRQEITDRFIKSTIFKTVPLELQLLCMFYLTIVAGPGMEKLFKNILKPSGTSVTTDTDTDGSSASDISEPTIEQNMLSEKFQTIINKIMDNKNGMSNTQNMNKSNNEIDNETDSETDSEDDEDNKNNQYNEFGYHKIDDDLTNTINRVLEDMRNKKDFKNIIQSFSNNMMDSNNNTGSCETYDENAGCDDNYDNSEGSGNDFNDSVDTDDNETYTVDDVVENITDTFAQVLEALKQINENNKNANKKI